MEPFGEAAGLVEQRAGRVKGRIVDAVQGTSKMLFLDEEIGFLKGRMRACYSVLRKRIGRVHNAVLSRATFLMNGVSLHTGSFSIPGVTTRGEM